MDSRRDLMLSIISRVVEHSGISTDPSQNPWAEYGLVSSTRQPDSNDQQGENADVLNGRQRYYIIAYRTVEANPDDRLVAQYAANAIAEQLDRAVRQVHNEIRFGAIDLDEYQLLVDDGSGPGYTVTIDGFDAPAEFVSILPGGTKAEVGLRGNILFNQIWR